MIFVISFLYNPYSFTFCNLSLLVVEILAVEKGGKNFKGWLLREMMRDSVLIFPIVSRYQISATWPS